MHSIASCFIFTSFIRAPPHTANFNIFVVYLNRWKNTTVTKTHSEQPVSALAEVKWEIETATRHFCSGYKSEVFKVQYQIQTFVIKLSKLIFHL